MQFTSTEMLLNYDYADCMKCIRTNNLHIHPDLLMYRATAGLWAKSRLS